MSESIAKFLNPRATYGMFPPWIRRKPLAGLGNFNFKAHYQFQKVNFKKFKDKIQEQISRPWGKIVMIVRRIWRKNMMIMRKMTIERFSNAHPLTFRARLGAWTRIMAYLTLWANPSWLTLSKFNFPNSISKPFASNLSIIIYIAYLTHCTTTTISPLSI